MKRLAKLTAVVLALTVLAPATLPRSPDAEVLVTVIHNGRPIAVSVLAVPRHLLHEDTLAECRTERSRRATAKS